MEAVPKKNIIVVGAGIAGLLAAQQLKKRSDATVTLVSDKDEFVFLPRLTEVFSETLARKHAIVKLADVWKGELVIERVGMVNPQEKKIELTSGKTLTYDILVLALGSKSNFFGTPGKEHAYSFYSKEDCEKLKEHVERMLEADEKATHTFIVVGGGPTGVETAYVLNKLVKKKRPEAQVIILERAPAILKVLPENLSKAAIEKLQNAGIELRTGFGVTNITPLSVEVQKPDGAKETVPCYTTIWAAGSAAATIPLTGITLTQRGEVPVTPTLQLEGHPEVFAIGDIAGSGTPKTAQAAVQQANLTVQNIARFIEGKPLAPFALHDKGVFIALEEDTVGIAFGKLLKGFVVRMMRDQYYKHLLRQYD